MRQLASICLALGAGSACAAEWHVAPDGRAGGAGTLADPWDLTSALAPPEGRVEPGDTIWLHGGTYRGCYRSVLRGTSMRPIVVRAFAGERPVIDATRAGQAANNVTGLRVEVEGGWTWYWGIEITNSDTSRRVLAVPDPGGDESNRSDRRGNSIDIWAPGTRLINCVIRDTGQGPGVWSQAPDAELSGNLIANNGWQGPERRAGHAIYAQNELGGKRFDDNLCFNQFGYGIHAYGSEQAFLNNLAFTGNVVANNSFLIGGGQPIRDLLLEENCFYGAAGTVQLGYSDALNDGLVARGNRFMAGLRLRFWEGAVVSGNQLWDPVQDGQSKIVGLALAPGQVPRDYAFTGNRYVAASADGYDFYISPSPPYDILRFADWRALGLDAGSTVAATPSRRPEANEVIVRANRYESGRAHVVVYNWRRLDSVAVDLATAGFAAGDAYELRNAQDYDGDVSTGTLTSTMLEITMTGRTTARPIGFSERLYADTFPEFGTFLVRRTASGGGATGAGTSGGSTTGAPGGGTTGGDASAGSTTGSGGGSDGGGGGCGRGAGGGAIAMAAALCVCLRRRASHAR
ncbi:MAG TPA: hypothetical protein VEL07_13340 [Planctomycetota bacterium]|nr:hypothetical protein [Planctomycetota bacterium]